MTAFQCETSTFIFHKNAATIKEERELSMIQRRRYFHLLSRLSLKDINKINANAAIKLSTVDDPVVRVLKRKKSTNLEVPSIRDDTNRKFRKTLQISEEILGFNSESSTAVVFFEEYHSVFTSSIDKSKVLLSSTEINSDDFLYNNSHFLPAQSERNLGHQKSMIYPSVADSITVGTSDQIDSRTSGSAETAIETAIDSEKSVPSNYLPPLRPPTSGSDLIILFDSSDDSD